MQLSLVFLFVIVLVSINGVPLRLNIQNPDTLSFPTDRQSFLTLLSQNDPSKVLLSMFMGAGADPEKVTAIIVLLDDLILKAQEGHNGVVDAKSEAALKLDAAVQNLQNANVAVQTAEDDITAANQRIDTSNSDRLNRYPTSEAELATLLQVREKLQHLLDINTTPSASPSTPATQISLKSKTKDVSPISQFGSFNLLSVLQKADPEKLKKVIASVDELIDACQATMQKMDDEADAASAELAAAEKRKLDAVAAQQAAVQEKDAAQAAYEQAITNLTGKEKRELELLEQVKLLLMGLLPGGSVG